MDFKLAAICTLMPPTYVQGSIQSIQYCVQSHFVVAGLCCLQTKKVVSAPQWLLIPAFH